jgi:hypothetical protein
MMNVAQTWTKHYFISILMGNDAPFIIVVLYIVLFGNVIQTLK